MFWLVVTAALGWGLPNVDLPVVTSVFFQAGNQWTWDYYDARSGALYSSETYTVVANESDVITFELSTRMANDSQARPHHRMRADLKRCLAKYRNPAERKPWPVELFYLENNRWISAGITHPLAFEEKFNCNGFAGDSTYQKPPLINKDESELLFQHRPKGAPNRSWYLLSGPHAGVAAKKDFYQGKNRNYFFRLRATASSSLSPSSHPSQDCETLLLSSNR